MSDEKAERQPFVWGCTGGIRDYNSKELPFFEWIAHQTTTEKFIVPKEDPRMDMGRNSEHYQRIGTGCGAERICGKCQRNRGQQVRKNLHRKCVFCGGK